MTSSFVYIIFKSDIFGTAVFLNSTNNIQILFYIMNVFILFFYRYYFKNKTQNNNKALDLKFPLLYVRRKSYKNTFFIND